MPVGNSDRGVGLGAGEIMFFTDYSYQFIDWRHDELPNEPFVHKGFIKSDIINFGLTIGLNDYWNISFSHLLGKRCMTWEGEAASEHHRTECSNTDFITEEDGVLQARGGYSGDSKLSAKYLLYNQGKGPGNRLYLGGGFVIPSSNTLLVSPYEIDPEDNDDDLEHRHFYMSDGAFKGYVEAQFFKKRLKMPVFWGGTLYYEHPLNKSDYGYSPSKVYEISLLALSGPIKVIKTNFFKISSIGVNLSIRHQSGAEWNGEIAPNSKSTTYIPGASILFMTKAGTFGINIQFPETDTFPMGEGVDLNDKADMMQISLSYRRVFDHVIDALYW